MKSHVETFARELLAAGWHPTPERCFVACGDGAKPRLVDHDVWQAMRAILATRQEPDGAPDDSRPPTPRTRR